MLHKEENGGILQAPCKACVKVIESALCLQEALAV